jgi:hypothetical protein
MKPYLHAKSSAKKFGGKPEDYLAIHDWFDSAKAALADVRHRAILHSAFGIYLAEQVFGHNLTNSDGKEVSVRDVGEQHVLEDLGRIPSVQDWLQGLEIQGWMGPDRARKSKVVLVDIDADAQKNLPEEPEPEPDASKLPQLRAEAKDKIAELKRIARELQDHATKPNYRIPTNWPSTNWPSDVTIID